jgi:hypothetical protein
VTAQDQLTPGRKARRASDSHIGQHQTVGVLPPGVEGGLGRLPSLTPLAPDGREDWSWPDGHPCSPVAIPAAVHIDSRLAPGGHGHGAYLSSLAYQVHDHPASVPLLYLAQLQEGCLGAAQADGEQQGQQSPIPEAFQGGGTYRS